MRGLSALIAAIAGLIPACGLTPPTIICDNDDDCAVVADAAVTLLDDSPGGSTMPEELRIGATGAARWFVVACYSDGHYKTIEVLGQGADGLSATFGPGLVGRDPCAAAF